MENTLVTVVRYRKRPVGAVVARKMADNKVVLSWSKCLVKPTLGQRDAGVEPDTFSKHTAIVRAVGRTDSKEYALTVSRAENVNQHSHPDIPSVIRPALREMAARARRYFKDGVFEETLTEEEMELGRQGPEMKIATIKAIRTRTGLGLKEAKDLYEKYF